MADLAVLTGDIVRSQRLSRAALDDVFRSLDRNFNLLGRGVDVPSRLTRVRGDGWQAVTAPAYALRAVFLARAAVRLCAKGLETRIGVAVGPGRVHGESGLEDAEGPAFVASGHSLDHMRKSQRIVGADLPVPLATALPLSEAISNRWTARQAQVASHALMLPSPSREDVANALDLTQQSLQRHWSAAAIAEISDACQTLERSFDDSLSLSA